MTRIHSVAGLHSGPLIVSRPFRAPHHTISSSGLAGRRRAAASGRGHARAPRRAVSRRAVGVPALEPRRAAPAARGRLRDDRARAATRCGCRPASCWSRRPIPARVGSPASVTAIAARCGEAELRRHRRRLSGPLLDRMDLVIDVQRPSAERPARSHRRPAHPRLGARVAAARERQRRRLSATGARCNGEMDARTVQRLVGARG